MHRKQILRLERHVRAADRSTSQDDDLAGCCIQLNRSRDAAMFAEVMQEDFYRDYRMQLERLLGISTDKTNQDIHELVEAGLIPQRVIPLLQLYLKACSDPVQISSLEKMLNARSAISQKMSSHESDQLFRFGHITAMARVIFGDDAKATRWLSKPKERFGGRKPYDMLSTTIGTEEVERMLVQVYEAFAL